MTRQDWFFAGLVAALAAGAWFYRKQITGAATVMIVDLTKKLDTLTGWTEAQKLASLDPAFRAKVLSLLARMEQRGFRPKVVYGWRDLVTQAELLKSGASSVSFSFHNALNAAGQPAALAADLCDRVTGYKDPAFFDALGVEAKALGLFWGGDWVSFKDKPHVQAVPNSALGPVKVASLAAAEKAKAVA